MQPSQAKPLHPVWVVVASFVVSLAVGTAVGVEDWSGAGLTLWIIGIVVVWGPLSYSVSRRYFAYKRRGSW